MTASAAAPQVHVVRFAPAKLNLTLAVTGRRADGYHSLHSVMVPLTLGDALTVRVAGSGATSDTLRAKGLPVVSNADNLVLRAIGATREAIIRQAQPPGPTPAFLATLLSKRIPVAAGLGGGSSDAAAAIDAALAAWGASLPAQAVSNLAASIGSDVPFFRAGCGAVVTGRGEFVESLPVMEEPPAVLLVTPRVAVSTATVFKAYASGRRPRTGIAERISESLAAELRREPTARVLLDRAADLALANDLVPAATATAPGLGEYLSELGRLLGRPVCQSGSGPSLWVLYPTLEAAREAARDVKRATDEATLPGLGSGQPFIAATLIAARTGSTMDASQGGEGSDVTQGDRD